MTNYDPYEQDREDSAVNEDRSGPRQDWVREVYRRAEEGDNAVGKWDEDFGQREAYTWEWEPTAIDRKNELMLCGATCRACGSIMGTCQLPKGHPGNHDNLKGFMGHTWINKQYPHTVTSGEWVGAVGIALIIIAIIIAFFMIPPAHGQTPDTSRLPAFENQFVWAQLTWDKSTHNCHVDAQPRDAGPGEMVGIDSSTCGEAERELLAGETSTGQTDSRPENDAINTLPDSPTPKTSPRASNSVLEPIVSPYWTTENKLLAGSMVAVGSFDLAQTCHSIANGGREVWMPMKSCGSLVGVGIAMGLGMTYLSYQLHRHGHHRLERIPFIGMIAGNTAGITYSKEHGAW